MPVDGERAPRLGEFFRKSCIDLLGELGYDEKLSRKFGLDLISDPPKNDYSFSRFPFSPNGRTAFEFTAEVAVNVEREVGTLLDKINSVNTSGTTNYSGVKGGVLITDVAVRDELIKNAQARRVFCWDTRALAFLA